MVATLKPITYPVALELAAEIVRDRLRAVEFRLKYRDIYFPGHLASLYGCVYTKGFPTEQQLIDRKVEYKILTSLLCHRFGDTR